MTAGLLMGSERADVVDIEVLDRLKAAGGHRYGHRACQGRGWRAALRGRFSRRGAGGAEERHSPAIRVTDKEEMADADGSANLILPSRITRVQWMDPTK